VIHVATVHWRSARWIDVQRAYLERNLNEPFRVYGALEEIDDAYRGRFDRAVDTIGEHAGKLNLLAEVIAEEADRDDLLVFLDGDAFPVADPLPVAREGLARSALVAIRRDENLGDRQPHPSFCVTTVGTWQDLHGDWSAGYPWEAGGTMMSDVGGNLLHALESRGLAWTPLLRSNRVDLHPVWFGVYGGVVYHHGAGFRPAVSRVDLATRPAAGWTARAARTPVLGAAARRWQRVREARWWRRRTAEAAALSEQVYDELARDPEFYRRFL
jgi:hypothetical protein